MFEDCEVLPYWLFLTAIVSAARTFQCYLPATSNRIMRILYSNSNFRETSALAAREFGSWSFLSCIVQINAGLNPHHSGAYNTALWSFIIFLVHFAFERIAYNTVGGRGLLAAEILAFVTFCWMCYARAYYLEFSACTDAGASAPLIHPHKGQPIPMM
ncbi:hypothetical protein D0868_11718 [Hortaea werneckii]|uniref:Ergosterol biosynthesis protein n=1 Tax=Hortaea werneckii TaxID=91943 RepID=A0A3M6XXE4_HORWE|nr:hypothetical protein D0868_11718 [Hortaea werneckii]